MFSSSEGNTQRVVFAHHRVLLAVVFSVFCRLLLINDIFPFLPNQIFSNYCLQSSWSVNCAFFCLLLAEWGLCLFHSILSHLTEMCAKYFSAQGLVVAVVETNAKKISSVKAMTKCISIAFDCETLVELIWAYGKKTTVSWSKGGVQIESSECLG